MSTNVFNKNIIGDVICDCVLLDGEISDLSALFWIQKVDNKNILFIGIYNCVIKTGIPYQDPPLELQI